MQISRQHSAIQKLKLNENNSIEINQLIVSNTCLALVRNTIVTQPLHISTFQSLICARGMRDDGCNWACDELG